MLVINGSEIGFGPFLTESTATVSAMETYWLSVLGLQPTNITVTDARKRTLQLILNDLVITVIGLSGKIYFALVPCLG